MALWFTVFSFPKAYLTDKRFYNLDRVNLKLNRNVKAQFREKKCWFVIYIYCLIKKKYGIFGTIFLLGLCHK